MNRQTKRMMKKDEERKRTAPRPVKAAANPTRERTSPMQFFREVVAELGKVAWPSRKEVFSYSLVVLVSSVVVAGLIFGMDFVFTKGVLALFGIDS